MGNKIFDNPQKALLIIDIQEDYTGETAKPPFPYKDSEKLITTVNNIIEEAPKRNMTIVYIRQEFDGFTGRLFSKLAGHSTAIKGTAGAKLDKRIKILSNNCFAKPMPDAFVKTNLEEFLNEHQIDGLYLVGLDAAGCVLHTARGALKRGYKVSIIKDSIVTLKEDKWQSILDKFKHYGANLITSKEL